MKKVLIFLLAILIVSCSESSESDENSLNNTTSIIGIWKPIKFIDVCSTGSEEVYVFTICEQQSRIEFTEYDTVNSTWYGNDSNCESDGPSNGVGSYTIIGNVLSITWQGEFDPIEDNNSEIWTIFELSSNKLKLSQTYSNPDPVYDICDGTGLWDYFYYEFVRAE